MTSCLIYVSSAIDALSESDLDDILRRSRARNREHDISGLLLFHDGSFLQVLEGPEEAVKACYERIRQDPRHSGTLCLFDRPVAERRFADWSMAFVPFDELDSSQKDGFVDLRDVAADIKTKQPSDVEHLIQTFLDSFRRF